MRIARWPTAALMVALAASAHATGSSNDSPYPLPKPLTSAAEDFGAHARADMIEKKMTLSEKLQLIHSEYQMSAVPGGGAGYIQGVPRLGIPDLNMVDSATGSGSTVQPSTTFPATVAVAASWDPYLAHDFGAVIADQLREQGFGMGLGGGTDLARDPRGGRAFEYLGEDPVLAGVLLAARTIGTQQHQVMATIKHYVLNDQETGRNGGNSQADERTMRELYLLAFEIAAKEGKPASVMCSYNRINGTYACENPHVLTDVLKNDWGFEGQVQSDWGAAQSTAPAINAGLDEEEDVGPTVYLTPALVTQALQSKQITEQRLDDMVRRKLYVMIKTGVFDHPAKGGGAIDFAKYRAFTQSVEEQSLVLLKNDNSQLPLAAPALRKIAVIGGHADTAVMTGGGSGNTRDPVTGNFSGCGGLSFPRQTGCSWWTNPWLKLPVPIVAAIQKLAPNAQVNFAGNTDQANPYAAYTQAQIDQAVALAKQSDVAIVVVAQESGEDFGELNSLALANPSNQDQLVEAVAAANPHTVVIVESGNPILMPWKDQVSAIVEAWFPGEGGGQAIANVLFGKVNPSGKLPFTFPLRDQDIPTWSANNGVTDPNPVYSEGLDIGYRWYDAKNIQPMFEFGYGLSYTHYSYSNLSVKHGPGNTLTASFTVRNDGHMAGAETAEVYLGVNYAGEPPRRLVGFQKVYLKPGEAKPVNVTITERAQSVWNTAANDWKFVPGSAVYVGASSRDIKLQGK
ncbi:MAG TPA: glycoside hydrolase family 3 C-terminal domain-containing protein [Paraburkholderia sp.]|jgi:beta-glucosidase|nr:glycoside hydrolase family 3 C-terminal domain-containing protein [Paraburkholderia sp.]